MDASISTEWDTDEDDDDDDETSVVEEPVGEDSAVEDAETIFIAQPDEADDMYINGPGRRRRRESFVETVTTVGLAGDRPKSCESDKEIETCVDEVFSDEPEEEGEEEEAEVKPRVVRGKIARTRRHHP